jgi:Bax protein
MKKVISYRQKLIELARIYKIDKVFDQNLKHTTYDIEIILLKNSVPIPSRRGYFSHKFINEVFKPFYDLLKNLFFINFKINKSLKLFFLSLRKKLSVKIYVIKSLKQFLNYSLDFFKFIVSSLVNYFKFIVSSLVNYFKFIVSSIINFFKVLSNTIIESLNDIYYFKVKDKIIKNIFSKAAYASLLAALVFSGFYIKEIITDVDSVKISLEIKSDKKEKNKNLKKKEVVKKQNDTKKNNSEDLAKLQNKEETADSVGDYNLNTQTVLNLFEDLEYNLDHVRNKKKVKPIYFTRLPKDLNSIKSVKEKKETFLQILLPLIVAENETIKKDREYLLKIVKNNESEKGKKWLNKKYRAYKVSDRNISELIKKIDIIPTSIALAQAAKESGWGTSRFALEGNAVYGQWTWNGDGIEPLEKTKDQNHKILKFPLLRASVKAYIANLNTHRGYRSFRAKRAELRKQNKKLTGIELIHELDNYAQTGKEYTKILEQIIKQNDLDELESVTIEDFKKNNQLKL